MVNTCMHFERAFYNNAYMSRAGWRGYLHKPTLALIRRHCRRVRRRHPVLRSEDKDQSVSHLLARLTQHAEHKRVRPTTPAGAVAIRPIQPQSLSKY